MAPFQAVAYTDGDRALAGRLVRPKGQPRAAIAVFPTIMNPTAAVEAKARALAEAGYLAMICDFYGAAPGDLVQANEWANDLRADPRAYRARLHAALAALREAAPDLRMAAIGFCMGGQAALELARDGTDLALVASFHGLLDTQAPAEPGAVRARARLSWRCRPARSARTRAGVLEGDGSRRRELAFPQLRRREARLHQSRSTSGQCRGRLRRQRRPAKLGRNAGTVVRSSRLVPRAHLRVGSARHIL